VARTLVPTGALEKEAMETQCQIMTRVSLGRHISMAESEPTQWLLAWVLWMTVPQLGSSEEDDPEMGPHRSDRTGTDLTWGDL
jgi:hypothetical protein